MAKTIFSQHFIPFIMLALLTRQTCITDPNDPQLLKIRQFVEMAPKSLITSFKADDGSRIYQRPVAAAFKTKICPNIRDLALSSVQPEAVIIEQNRYRSSYYMLSGKEQNIIAVVSLKAYFEDKLKGTYSKTSTESYPCVQAILELLSNPDLYKISRNIMRGKRFYLQNLPTALKPLSTVKSDPNLSPKCAISKKAIRKSLLH